MSYSPSSSPDLWNYETISSVENWFQESFKLGIVEEGIVIAFNDRTLWTHSSSHSSSSGTTVWSELFLSLEGRNILGNTTLLQVIEGVP